MRKKIRMMLSILICIAFVATGCSNTVDEKNTKTEATKKADATKEAEEEIQLGTFPLTKDQKSFSIMMAWLDDNNVEEFWFTKEYEKLTNVHIDWQPVPSEGWHEKRNIVLASGNLPDAIAGQGGYQMTPSDQTKYGSQELIIPLNDYIESDSIHFKKLMQEDPMIEKQIGHTNGNIYSFPHINVCYHCNYSQKMWVNWKWLENVGLEMPTTTDEFYNVLKAFKEKDANGNGDPNDEVPFLSSVDGWNHKIEGFLMNAFTYSDANSKIALENGKVVFSPVLDKYKEGLKYINMLYEEGLIAQESFTNNRDATVKFNESGDVTKIGAATGGWKGMFSGDSDRWKEYEILAPIKGPDGFVTATNYRLERDVSGGYFTITSAAKDPGLIVRWLDYFYSNEGVMHRLGREGIEWRKGKDGELDYNGNPAVFTSLEVPEDDPYYKKVCFGEVIPFNASKQFRESAVAPQDYYGEHPTANEVQLFVRTKEYEKVGRPDEECIPPLMVSEENISEFTLLKTSIEDFANDAIIKFFTGADDIDKEWDNYLKKLDNIGLDRYLELLQDAYDIYNSK